MPCTYMTTHPIDGNTLSFPCETSLEIITRFSTDVGAITDLTTLGHRILKELCHVGAMTHGALYVIDRERECYRCISRVGDAAPMLFPDSLPISHAVPHYLTQGQRPSNQDRDATTPRPPDADPAVHTALASMQAVRTVPHLNKGRLIGFSLLGSPTPPAEDRAWAGSLLAALAQTATNALDTILLSEDLHRSHMLMKRTDRLKSLETIAGGFAHEIRNPLTSIKTFIQLAPERKDDPAFIKEFSRIVLDDVYRIERLIQEILDYARYMEPKLTEEDVNDIVSSCLYFIDVKADSHGVKIEKELALDLPRVMLDRQQIKQVFLNLFLNAMDAMGDRGGYLRVRTRTLPKSNGKWCVQIDIEDTGEGIQDTNLDHIFDPFFTTKHESGEHEGTGLGLTIVHQIIQEHRGEIRVTSTVGVGTTFVVTLPALPS